MVQLLEKIEAGDASHADLDLLESVGEGILGRSLCALGDFAVYPVSSFMQKFPTSSAPTSSAAAAVPAFVLDRILAPRPARPSGSGVRCRHERVRLLAVSAGRAGAASSTRTRRPWR